MSMPSPQGPPSNKIEITSARLPWQNLGLTTYNTAFGAISAMTGNVCTYTISTGALASGTEPVTVTSTGTFVAPCDAGQVADLLFYGTNAENLTCKARVWGMHCLISDSISTDVRTVQWFHKLLRDSTTITLGATVGVSGGILTASHFFADTITLPSDERTGGPIGTTKDQPTTPDNGQAMYKNIDMDQARFIKIEMMINSSSVSCGVLLNLKGG